MSDKHLENQSAHMREQLIVAIIQLLNHLGERELDLVFRFAKALSE